MSATLTQGTVTSALDATEADASTTVKGLVTLATAPASASAPIAVGTNDSRMTNARTPSVHATTHVSGGSDAIAAATTSVSGLMSAVDKTKLDTLQGGTAVLSSGTVTVSTANITASSRIVVTQKTAAGTTGTRLQAPSGSRTPGTPGSFVINSVDTSGVVVATDTSTVDYLILS